MCFKPGNALVKYIKTDVTTIQIPPIDKFSINDSTLKIK